MEHTELNQFVESLNLEYMATFVPFSMSRSAKPIKSVSDYSINWKVFLKKGYKHLETDYMQGIGHLPKNMQPKGSNRLSLAEEKTLLHGVEHGKMAIGYRLGTRNLPKPDLLDILYCLVMDADVLNCSSFEEWADNFGYDTDSRNALKTYEACLENALALRAMIGNDALEKLSELYSDY